MTGTAAYIVTALVIFIGGWSLATVWFGGKVRKYRDAMEDMEWAERDRKFQLRVLAESEREAFAEDLMVAELDQVLADQAVASHLFQATLSEAGA